jgi:hypothetical protein
MVLEHGSEEDHDQALDFFLSQDPNIIVSIASALSWRRLPQLNLYKLFTEKDFNKLAAAYEKLPPSNRATFRYSLNLDCSKLKGKCKAER